jgi:general secretion pathway protein J
MNKNSVKQRGFTLLEVMIALTVFAVISGLAWQILDGAMKTTGHTDQRSAALNQLQRTWNLFDRDFFQLQPRAPRGEEQVFTQHDQQLALTTLSGVSGQLRLERVEWRVHDGRLWRTLWPEIDGPVSQKREEVPILDGVKAMHWRFFDEGWADKWQASDRIPEGVELTLEMENAQRWRWVFITPGGEAATVAEPPSEATAETESGKAAATDAAVSAQTPVTEAKP